MTQLTTTCHHDLSETRTYCSPHMNDKDITSTLGKYGTDELLPCLRLPPELNDGSSSYIHPLVDDGIDRLGYIFSLWADGITDQLNAGHTSVNDKVEVQLVYMTRAELATLLES